VEISELLKKVRKIEIRSRGLSNNLFAGQYHSAFKGRGMSFSEVREYQYGDDIRAIDWNVTARFNRPYVKIYEEERELTVMILADLSGSSHFATKGELKRELIAQVAATLAFSALQNNDKVGLLVFTDKIEKYIAPSKGKSQVLRIIRELIDFQPKSNGTSLDEALRYFTNVAKKRCIGFLISDFIDVDDNTGKMKFENALKVASRKHDLIALNVKDSFESQLSGEGLIRFSDPETGEVRVIDLSDNMLKNRYMQARAVFDKELSTVFAKNKVSTANLTTGSDFVPPLMRLFSER
jgi:uncharacterized protein (DUF58 family)